MSLINFYFMAVLLLSPNKIEKEETDIIADEIVTATTYKPTSEETDSTPNITASGFKISKKNPKKHRIIAISRDLKKRFKFGSRVRIKGAGKYSGEYVVQDVMNKRYRKRIDILINPKDKQTTIKNVKLYKVI